MAIALKTTFGDPITVLTPPVKQYDIYRTLCGKSTISGESRVTRWIFDTETRRSYRVNETQWRCLQDGAEPHNIGVYELNDDMIEDE